MKTIYKKYIRNNWYWINRVVIFHLILLIIAFIGVLAVLEMLCNLITN